MSEKQEKKRSPRRKYPDHRYPKCRTCKAWFENDYDHQYDVRLGQCRLRPPKTMTNEYADWIETEEGDFCLEHVAAAPLIWSESRDRSSTVSGQHTAYD